MEKNKRETKTLTPLYKNKHGFLNIMSMCSQKIKLQVWSLYVRTYDMQPYDETLMST